MATTQDFSSVARLKDLFSKKIKQMEANAKGSFQNMVNNSKKFSNAVENVNTKTKAMSKGFANVKKNLSDVATRFGPAAIAATIFTKAILSIGNAITFVTENTETFEKTLSAVKAILEPTGKEFDTLAKRALELGNSTLFTASEAAEAFVALGKLGFTTNQILASSADVLNIAAAAEIDLARAAELTAITLKQFGLDANDATKVTDVMALSFTSSALDAEKFGESMKFAGPPAAQLGINVERTTGALAALANAGISGSMAGTALRRVMLELGDAGGKVAKIIGVAKFATLDFNEKLLELQKKGLSPTEIKNTFGLLASTSAGILINGADQVEKFGIAFEKAEGNAQRMADTMQDNVAGASKRLESAQQGLGIAIGSAFGEAKRKRIEFYTRTVNFATSFIEAHKDALKIVGNILSGTFIAAINIVVTAWRGWISIMELSIGALLKNW